MRKNFTTPRACFPDTFFYAHQLEDVTAPPGASGVGFLGPEQASWGSARRHEPGRFHQAFLCVNDHTAVTGTVGPVFVLTPTSEAGLADPLTQRRGLDPLEVTW